MPSGIIVGGSGGSGQVTGVAAGTPIQVLVPPRRGMRSRLDTLLYTPAATSHTLTVMQALAYTTVAAAAAAAQTSVVLTADPGPAGNGIAAGDVLVFEKPGGGYHLGTVATWTAGTKTLTLTANVPAGGFASGGRVWNFGIVTDAVPATGNTQPQYALATGAQRTVSNVSGNGVIGSNANYEPLVLSVDNITNAGALNQVSWIYTIEPGSDLPSLLAGQQPQEYDLASLGLPYSDGWTDEGCDADEVDFRALDPEEEEEEEGDANAEVEEEEEGEEGPEAEEEEEPPTLRRRPRPRPRRAVPEPAETPAPPKPKKPPTSRRSR